MNIPALVQKAMSSIPGALRATITVTKTVKGNDYNPATGTRTDTTASFTSTLAVVVPPKREWADGALRLPIYDKLVTVPAADCTFAPDIGHTLVLNAETWRIVSREPLDPSGAAPIIYTLGIAK